MNIIIAEAQLDPKKRLPYSLQAIKGIGLSRAKLICITLGLSEMMRLGDLTSEQLRSLGDFIAKEYGNCVGSELIRREKGIISSIIASGTYRGLRHRKHLPVHGQRTKSNAKVCRGKAGAKGLNKKVKK